MDIKTCTKCCEPKDVLLFAKDKTKADGRSSVCKQCRSEYQCEWQKRNKDRINAYQRQYKKLNPEKTREWNTKTARKWRAANPEAAKRKQKRLSIKKLYGVTLEWFEETSVKQNGLCAICGGPPTAKGLCVDHCHRTGKIRELLCSHCNTLLHKMEQDIEWYRKAQDYLIWHEVGSEGSSAPAHSPDEALRRESL